ncbi:MAG: four helix bundle protein [Verrucomicrobiia bacterium]
MHVFAQSRWLFAHGRLEVYQRGRQLVDWFHALPAGADLPSRCLRQPDKAITSTVLNIADGNGRRKDSDHREFLEQAESA